jgi:hypothetical protein
MADVFDLSVQHGDLLVLATDGVWDNMTHEEMEQLINECGVTWSQLEADSSPHQDWDTLVGMIATQEVAVPTYYSPRPSDKPLAPLPTASASPLQFIADTIVDTCTKWAMSRPAGKQATRRFANGKPDDTTVIVAMIHEAQSSKL